MRPWWGPLGLECERFEVEVSEPVYWEMAGVLRRYRQRGQELLGSQVGE